MSDQIVSVDKTQRAFKATWEQAEKYLRDKNTGKFLGALAFQGIDYIPLDATLQTLVTLIGTRLNSDDNFILNPTILPPGKVLLQPRGSYASRSTLRGHVDLDLDLVFPENFKIAFEGEKTGDDPINRTISQVIAYLPVNSPADGHDPSGNLVVDKDGLRLVLIYVWGKLVGKDLNYRLPHSFLDRPLDIPDNYSITVDPAIRPTMNIADPKTLATLTRSISAQITDNPQYPYGLDVDFFVKIATKRFGGEEVLVGVDKDGPLGVRQYQITTFIPSGKEWLGTEPLSPINMTALMALKWWKNSFEDDKTIKPFTIRDPASPSGSRAGKPSDIKLKSHHFLSVINELNRLPPTDPLYVSQYSSLPFSLVRVMDVMVKVLTYLQRAYQPPERFTIVYYNDWDPSIPSGQYRALFPFPQITCGVFEVLYKQITTSIVDYDAIIKSLVIPTFSGRLQAALFALLKQDPSFTPTTYTFEEE